MYILHKQITRHLLILENKDGYCYFKVSEGGKDIMESDLYQTSTECAAAGMKFLDQLHEEIPLRSDYIPTMEDFLLLLQGGKK